MKTVVRNGNEIIFQTESKGRVTKALTPDTYTGTIATISIEPFWGETIIARLSTATTSEGGDFRDDVIHRESTLSEVPPGKTVALRIHGPNTQSQRTLLISREK
jgi:hypothetical protein